MLLTLYFFRGTGPLAYLERIGVCPPFTPLSDVPGHVSIGVCGLYAEAIWPRVSARPFLGQPQKRTDLMESITLPCDLPQSYEAGFWLNEQSGTPYSARTIAQDAAARVWPSLFGHSETFRGWTCSSLALTACERAGLKPSLQYGEVDHAWTPWDVLLWARSVAATL